LAATSGLWALALVGGAAIWHLNLRMLGVRLPFAAALRAFLFSQLCRYVPGKVWMLGGRTWLGAAYGADGTLVAASTAVEFGTYMLAGLFVSAVWMLTRGSPAGGIPPAAFAGAAAVLLAALHPAVFRAALNTAARLAGRPPVRVDLRVRTLGILFACYVVQWGVLGLAFRLFLLAMGVDGVGMADSVGVLAVASCAGVLAIIAPGGVGVREGVLSLLLVSCGVAEGVAAGAAILSRLWMIAVELAVTGVAFAVRSRRGAAAEPEARP